MSEPVWILETRSCVSCFQVSWSLERSQCHSGLTSKGWGISLQGKRSWASVSHMKSRPPVTLLSLLCSEPRQVPHCLPHETLTPHKALPHLVPTTNPASVPHDFPSFLLLQLNWTGLCSPNEACLPFLTTFAHALCSP